VKSFGYVSAPDVQTAVRGIAEEPNAKFLGGGTNLVDLMRQNIERPDTVIDITQLPLTGVDLLPDGGVRIGALVRNSHLAANPLIRSRYPVLSQAILYGASAQLRNMATVGGNLLQRTRCLYFYDNASACNKRTPGSGCAARTGFHREHAVFGASDQCVATHPSDMAVALAILDAVVHVQGPDGRRTIAIGDFFALPGATPHLDNTLCHGELVVGVELPPSEFADHSWYLKVRDRHSYAFALVSAAAGLTIDDGVITSAALALGGVAAMPWRLRDAERALVGRRADERAFHVAAELAMDGAEPLAQNAFKVDLGRHSVVRALTRAVGGPASEQA